MGLGMKRYCPYCGHPITDDTWKWLRFGPGTKCFHPDCEGEDGAPVPEL